MHRVHSTEGGGQFYAELRALMPGYLSSEGNCASVVITEQSGGPGRAEKRTEEEKAVPVVEENRYHSNGIRWGTLDLRRESPNAEKPRLTVNQITLVERVKDPTQGRKPLVPRDTEESKDVGL